MCSHEVDVHTCKSEVDFELAAGPTRIVSKKKKQKKFKKRHRGRNRKKSRNKRGRAKTLTTRTKREIKEKDFYPGPFNFINKRFSILDNLRKRLKYLFYSNEKLAFREKAFNTYSGINRTWLKELWSSFTEKT